MLKQLLIFTAISVLNAGGAYMIGENPSTAITASFSSLIIYSIFFDKKNWR